MQQAHEQGHTWKPTDKALEKAVYASVEASIDQKRRFRDDAGELGYVGGEYTKKSAAGRAQYDAKVAEEQAAATRAMQSKYAQASDFL